MSPKTKKDLDLSIELQFSLFDLPTAQHKAGLAGLVLQIRSMISRPEEFTGEDIPELMHVTETSVSVRVTERSLQMLLDDLYSAKIREVAVVSKWAGTSPKEVRLVDVLDPKTKKQRQEKRFIYDVVQPDSPFLQQNLHAGDADWLKLWRDMIWAIPRAKPTTRGPFNDRANDKPTAEAAKVWKELVAFAKAREKNTIRTCSVSSALLLGAQAVNAESIKFSERSDHALLLHFWQLTVLVFVPQAIDREGKGQFVGFTLAIPEVANVKRFCEDYPRVLQSLPTQRRGYLPAGAVIDIPAQAGLEFMRMLSKIVGHEDAQERRIARNVSSIEFVHLVKLGNNVKTLSSGQIVPNQDLLDRYSDFVGSGRSQKGPKNPLFRAGRLRSLIAGTRWFDGLRDTLIKIDWTILVRCEDTPRSMPWFFNDAKKQFDLEWNEFQNQLERYNDVTDEKEPASMKPTATISILVHRMIQTYIRTKTEERSGMTWKDFQNNKVKSETGGERVDVPKAYSDAREKTTSTLYLAMRSRRDQDFADYFTATICSVPQFLSAADYQTVAKHLLDETADVKTLTLLAISANS